MDDPPEDLNLQWDGDVSGTWLARTPFAWLTVTVRGRGWEWAVLGIDGACRFLDRASSRDEGMRAAERELVRMLRRQADVIEGTDDPKNYALSDAHVRESMRPR